jgi:hypothetical protein
VTDIINKVRRGDDTRKRLTFFMCMDRSDVPFEVFSTAEALAAVFHFADINASLTSLSCFSFYCGIVAGGRDAATATLFCQIRNGNRGGRAYPRSTTFRSK